MIEIYKSITPNTEWFFEVMMGVRNSFSSWDQSDTVRNDDEIIFGEKDLGLVECLARSDSSERKFLRQLPVLMVIRAPLYWWKEFDTYKVGTTANSTSTMHTILREEFHREQFATDQLLMVGEVVLDELIEKLNDLRNRYIATEDPKFQKQLWYNIIQLLPESWMQTRTVTLNYEVLKRIYEQRRGHKLLEWRSFCKYLESLPYGELIIFKGGKHDES